MGELKTVNKGGRPAGSGGGQQITARLRKEIYSALNICKKNGHPLDQLLAEQIQKDASGTLSKLSKFVPQEVHLGEGGSEFAQALSQIAVRIAEADLTSAGKQGQLIDITPETPEQTVTQTDTKRKKTKK
tara:strand:- start:68 stop:457 length:390 start_codon:yes stop_codon:yes gene_type:complete